MSSFSWPPSGGIPTYPTFSAFPTSATDGSAAIALDTDTLYIYNLATTSWIPVGGSSAVLSVGTIDSQAPSANGAVISSNQLVLQSASATKPGLVNGTTQSFAGNKTFTGSVAASNLSGTNTGDVTLTAVGSAPNADSASLSGQVLTLQPFNSTNPGVVPLSGGGTANFLRADGSWATPAGTGVTTVSVASANGLAGSSSGGTTPSLTISTSITGILQGNGTAISAASTTGTGNVVLAGTPTISNLNAGSTQITNVTDPTSAQQAATKNYVDTVASGLNPLQSVFAATTGSNIPGTYVQVGGGIGDTFTITATTTFTLDGTTPTTGARILFKDQTSGQQNGVYNLTTLANVGVLGAIFTRSLDYDTVADINAGDLIPVTNGTVNATTSWLQTATVTSVGTSGTPLVFAQWTANPANYLLKANNLSDVATKATAFNNISPMTTGGDLIYGGASGVGTRLANGNNGQVLTSGGTTAAPTWQTPGAGTGTVTSVQVAGVNGLSFTGGPVTTSGTITAVITAPTIQRLTSNGSQTGWLFTISTSTTCAVGDTYTNNSHTFTVQYALSAQSGQVLFMSGTGTTSGSTLTRATGSGTASVTFSATLATASYTTPSSPSPLYIDVEMVGAGGGGSAATIGSASAGGGAGAYQRVQFSGGALLASYPYTIGQGGGGSTGGQFSSFGNNIANGGTGASSGVGGGGGTNTISTGTTEVNATGNGGQGAVNGTGVGGFSGGLGGPGWFQGLGAGQTGTSSAGGNGIANSGSGGGGGAQTAGAGGSGGSGFIKVKEYYQ